MRGGSAAAGARSLRVVVGAPMFYGYVTLPHLASPYKGEGKNMVLTAKANHFVNELLNIFTFMG